MAQPMSRIHPPFALLLFLTDNTFQAESVMSRWNFTKQELLNLGVAVDSFASDGDSRPLKVMKMKSGIGVQDLSFFDCSVAAIRLIQHILKTSFTLVQNVEAEF